MKKQSIVLIIIAILLLGSGIYFTQRNKSSSNSSSEELASPAINSQIENQEAETTTNTFDVELEPSLIQNTSYEGGGIYETYNNTPIQSLANTASPLVLYFHADWDPTDVALDKNLTAQSNLIPKDMKIVKIAYDTNKNLVEQYKVRQQNTLIRVDQSGKEITRRSMGIISVEQIAGVLWK